MSNNRYQTSMITTSIDSFTCSASHSADPQGQIPRSKINICVTTNTYCERHIELELLSILLYYRYLIHVFAQVYLISNTSYILITFFSYAFTPFTWRRRLLTDFHTLCKAGAHAAAFFV